MAIAWIDTPPAEFADLARRLWSGETPQSAAAAQRALLDAHVSSPFRVGWVAVDVPGSLTSMGMRPPPPLGVGFDFTGSAASVSGVSSSAAGAAFFFLPFSFLPFLVPARAALGSASLHRPQLRPHETRMKPGLLRHSPVAAQVGHAAACSAMSSQKGVR